MEVNLSTATSLLSQIEEQGIEDSRLKASLEEAVQILQVQGPTARVALPTDVEGTVTGIISTQKELPAPKPDQMDVPSAQELFASMEKLLVLFSVMARENREMNREASYEALMTRVAQMNQAAGDREKGADALRAGGAGALAMSILGGAVGMVGGGLGARFSLKGDTGANMAQFMQTGAQGAGTVFGGAGSLSGTEGNVQNQLQQAEADVKQAEAEKLNADFQRALGYEGDFKDIMSKMNETLRSMLDAKNRATEAAARA